MPSGNSIGAVSSHTKNPVAADPTGRRIIESQPGEELWIIGRMDKQLMPGDEMIPGSGVLAKTENENKLVPVPSSTPTSKPPSPATSPPSMSRRNIRIRTTEIEAVYVFPLPDNAAVSEFVDDHRKPPHPRHHPRARGGRAHLQGCPRPGLFVATLLTQERPNIFTQKVANIEPGKKIDVNLRYFHTLTYNDGAYEFVFPMVVGPRFNPAGSTQGVGRCLAAMGVARVARAPRFSTCVPTSRSGHDISLSLAIDAGLPIDKLGVSSHAIEPHPGRRGQNAGQARGV